MSRERWPQTPSQTVGPFFHTGLISGGENVLASERTRGERIRITGFVLDGDGEPVGDAMLETWQPDANGIFPHPADPRSEQADPHFRCFGRVATAVDGSYALETVMPGVTEADSLEGRAPFIYLRIFARGLLIHAVTRIYFDGERNEADPVLRRIDADRRGTLIARKQPGSGLPTYRFDVVLQGENETVFFDV